MNIFLAELFKNFNPNRKGFKKKVLSFTLFLLISTVFWFLNVLGEEYTESISYPVKYINLPENKAESKPLPSRLELKISTSGYRLLDYYLTANIPQVIIDYNNIKAKTILGKYKYILTKDLSEDILRVFKSVNIKSINPDTIVFDFHQILKKKVAVQPLATYTLANGFVEKGKMFSKPDSIVINGPQNLIEKINMVYTGVVSLAEINKTTKRNVALKKISGIKFSTYRINVTIPIEQATEKIIELPIHANNEVGNSTIRLIPNTVSLSYKVGLSKYTDITKDQFSVFVNYTDSTKNSDVLKVELLKFPKDIYEIEYSPNFIEYIIETND